MTDGQRRSPRGGGALLAFAILGGIGIGAALGEPSIGFLVGAGLGILVMVLLWIADRRRA